MCLRIFVPASNKTNDLPPTSSLSVIKCGCTGRPLAPSSGKQGRLEPNQVGARGCTEQHPAAGCGPEVKFIGGKGPRARVGVAG